MALPLVMQLDFAEQLDRDGWRPGRLWAPLISGTQLIAGPLLALGLFVYTFGFGQSVLSAGLTLALLILPIVIFCRAFSLTMRAMSSR